MMELLDTSKFEVYPVFVSGSEWIARRDGLEVPVDKNDFSIFAGGRKILFDCACIMIHGTPGENGLLPAYFEMLGIPHTTCGPLAGALTFNKFACKKFLETAGIPSAKAVLVRTAEEVNPRNILEVTGLPCFVKPNNGGSSFATTKVKSAGELLPAIQLALTIDSEAIIEEFIPGTEITNGLMELNGALTVFPITEIESATEFFDVEAKYQGLSREITPARIPDSLRDQVFGLSRTIYKHLNCKGIVRIDYIIRDGRPCFLEVNTIPGMSAASIVPQQLRAMGMDARDVFTDIIEEAVSRMAARKKGNN